MRAPAGLPGVRYREPPLDPSERPRALFRSRAGPPARDAREYTNREADSKVELHEEADGGDEMEPLYGNGEGEDAFIVSFVFAPANPNKWLSTARRVLFIAARGEMRENH